MCKRGTEYRKHTLGSISFISSTCCLLEAYTWVPVLQLCPTDVCVLFVDDKLDISRVLLDLVCQLNARIARSDCQHLQLPG
jgi:hypothetical protein